MGNSEHSIRDDSLEDVVRFVDSDVADTVIDVPKMKISLVGDRTIGKTTFAGMLHDPEQFLLDSKSGYVPTCYDFFTKRVEVDGAYVDVSVADVKGSLYCGPSFDDVGLRRMDYARTDCFVLMFSLFNIIQWNSLYHEPDLPMKCLFWWLEDIRNESGGSSSSSSSDEEGDGKEDSIPILLVGLKYDLVRENQVDDVALDKIITEARQRRDEKFTVEKISLEDAESFAQKHGLAGFIPCSSVRGDNLMKVVAAAVRLGIHHKVKKMAMHDPAAKVLRRIAAKDERRMMREKKIERATVFESVREFTRRKKAEIKRLQKLMRVESRRKFRFLQRLSEDVMFMILYEFVLIDVLRDVWAFRTDVEPYREDLGISTKEADVFLLFFGRFGGRVVQIFCNFRVSSLYQRRELLPRFLRRVYYARVTKNVVTNEVPTPNQYCWPMVEFTSESFYQRKGSTSSEQEVSSLQVTHRYQDMDFARKTYGHNLKVCSIVVPNVSSDCSVLPMTASEYFPKVEHLVFQSFFKGAGSYQSGSQICRDFSLPLQEILTLCLAGHRLLRPCLSFSAELLPNLTQLVIIGGCDKDFMDTLSVSQLGVLSRIADFRLCRTKVASAEDFWSSVSRSSSLQTLIVDQCVFEGGNESSSSYGRLSSVNLRLTSLSRLVLVIPESFEGDFPDEFVGHCREVLSSSEDRIRVLIEWGDREIVSSAFCSEEVRKRFRVGKGLFACYDRFPSILDVF